MTSNETTPKPLFTEFPAVSTSAWEETIRKDLKGADYEKKLIWKTDEGIAVKPYYRSEDIAEMEFTDAIPGRYPYVRGNCSQHNNWIIREDIQESDLAKANLLGLDAIKRGAQAIGLKAKNVASLDDVSALLKGIDITKTEIHFTSCKSYPELMSYFIQYVQSNAINPAEVKGSLNFDPIAYLLLHGKPYHTVEENDIEMAQLMNKMMTNLPSMKALTVNGHVFNNAGATIIQEIAYSLAAGNEYLFRLTSQGIKIDEITERMQFTFGIGSNYFLEIAKLRAFRMLWSAVVKEYSPSTDKTAKAYIHAVSSLWNKTLYDPYVNLLRITTEGMSASIGGANSITLQPFDVAYSDPCVLVQRIAGNTQIILKEESYLSKVIDPAAGSYYIESLTHSIAEHAWDLFKGIEAQGGFMKLALAGEIKSEIEKSCHQRDLDIANRKTVFLGTNQYANLNENMLDKIHVAEKEVKAGLKLYRGPEAFEKIRLQTEAFEKETGKRPIVFLLTIGNLAMRKARASFSVNFFGCAAYKIIDNLGFESAEEGVKAALDAKADVVIICSSDDEYTELVPQIGSMLKTQKPSVKLIVAGYPKEQIESFKAAGVDDFIHVRSNLLETLQKYNAILLH
ncbi:MAG: methylmalonyl-CoA mutase family protein [Bacteroidota bacterium]